MNNLYHKVTVASVGIVLSLALGANKEAKAVTFTLTPTTTFFLWDQNGDQVADMGYGGINNPVGIRHGLTYGTYGEYYREEYRSFYEFNIANLALAPNTVISSAIFQTKINSVEWYSSLFRLQAYGYKEKDQFTNPSIFDAGEYLDQKYLSSVLGGESQGILTFNILPFIKQIIKNNGSSAGFGIRFLDQVPYADEEGYVYLDAGARLEITTEPVPEPATIFGSAIGLCLGGWLKRRKSALQNKTTSQN